MVRPEEVDDDRAQIMAREIAKRLHAEASYTAGSRWSCSGRPGASNTPSDRRRGSHHL